MQPKNFPPTKPSREEKNREVKEGREQIIASLAGLIGNAGVGLGGGVGAMLNQMHKTLKSQRGLLTSTLYAGLRRDGSP